MSAHAPDAHKALVTMPIHSSTIFTRSPGSQPVSHAIPAQIQSANCCNKSSIRSPSRAPRFPHKFIKLNCKRREEGVGAKAPIRARPC